MQAFSRNLRAGLLAGIMYDKKAYNENLEKDRLLINKYRSRYLSLNNQTNKTKPGSKSNSKEMYEYFKQEGPIMRDKYIKGQITVSEFKKWIDSTKRGCKKSP